jgi:hypothetical protein
MIDNNFSPVFLGDAFNDGAFESLLNKTENPFSTVFIYIADGAVSLYQGEIKNPYHLVYSFSQFLQQKNIAFSLNDNKSFLIETDALSAPLLEFASGKPEIADSPDLRYLTFKFHSNYYLFSNPQIITIVLITGACLLFLIILFSLFNNKASKRVVVLLSVIFVLFNVFVTGYERSLGFFEKKTATTLNTFTTTESFVTDDAAVDIEASELLDRTIYKIKCEYSDESYEPYRINIYFDIENKNDIIDVYEADFPYEIDEGVVSFKLGEYPPNPFETEISFPIYAKVKARIVTEFAGDRG